MLRLMMNLKFSIFCFVCVLLATPNLRADMCSDFVISAAGRANPDPRRNPDSAKPRLRQQQEQTPTPTERASRPTDSFEPSAEYTARVSELYSAIGIKKKKPTRLEVTTACQNAIEVARRDLQAEEKSRNIDKDPGHYRIELHKVEEAIRKLIELNLTDFRI